MMSASTPSPSFFRGGSARLLVCGALLCTLLFAAHLHVLASLGALLTVALAGAIRRFQEEASHAGGVAQKGFETLADGKTGVGLADRKALEARLETEWGREHRPGGEPTALLLVAIDAFGQLEEKGGALAGNVAMLTLASALGRMLPREADLLSRYDECTFAVLLSGTDLPGSLRVAARLRWAIVRLGIANARTKSGFLTACMGVAVQHTPDSLGTAALLAAAEKALTKAQQVGHDSLEYVVLGEENEANPSQKQDLSSAPGQAAATASAYVSGPPMGTSMVLPSIRAWSAERATALHSPQS